MKNIEILSGIQNMTKNQIKDAYAKKGITINREQARDLKKKALETK